MSVSLSSPPARPARATKGKPNEIDVHVGARVRQRRRLLGLSQEQLGKALGLTFQQVQKYERGVNRIGASRLHQLGAALGVPVGFFFEGLAGGSGGAGSGASGGASGLDPDAMSSRETLDLVRAYYAVGDPAVRRKVVDLLRALAGAR